jgi:hypothetical protein
MPAIVLMLVAGILIGPVLGIFDPARDIGPLMGPMISIAVAIILFEGGLSLNFHTLQDAVGGVRRLVYIGAPLGWLMSALSLHYVAGLSWSSSAVFGGIMIVTGPTVSGPALLLGLADLVVMVDDTYAFVDGRFEVRSKGRSLPYKIFDMDQRVTHAAITDNKRLGAVLEHIKEMQDKAPPKYPVRTNSEKMGYKSNGRRHGRPSGSRTKKSIVQAAK